MATVLLTPATLVYPIMISITYMATATADTETWDSIMMATMQHSHLPKAIAAISNQQSAITAIPDQAFLPPSP